MENNFETRYTKYGYGVNVRKSYEHLPFQGFWTWVTGKSLNSAAPKHARETLLTQPQLILQISWGYAVFFASVIIGKIILDADISWMLKVLYSLPIFCMIVNRSRGLLHTSHYVIHGAVLRSKTLSRFYYKWLLSIPVLHTPWDEYMKIHVVKHHGLGTFSTEHDVDQVFMTKHGFYNGMREPEFWLKIFLAPFHPLRIYEHIRFRILVNFIVCNWNERLCRATYWFILITVAYASGYFESFLIYYVGSILVVTQFSSWIQHITEHQWFGVNRLNWPKHVFYGSLTWGRFFGSPYPVKAEGWRFAFMFCKWVLKVTFIDIPLRLFAYMQDLPSHDFHHRFPAVGFWSIAPERAAHENKPSRYGPMTETWSMKEGILIARDHLCRGQSDPFDIEGWYQANKHTYAAFFDNKQRGALSTQSLKEECRV
ncbi:hypothetical protein OKW98_09465 [Pseudomonas sp. KU26590]|uniref:hypothetical protein n=1 Tax=Pseudomonas sp. KU26590 TaxID=2991051 RepID=UPI00223D3F7C|nr:hypothetical protein [Pseudomonas sp. KU26590]UZJ61912.1 hypothetical protein OKW98_09465 [Pseudomonas sp. KU26590]